MPMNDEQDTPSSGAEPPCVICAKPQAARYRPFCSKRCAEVDLGRWLTGSYRVETAEPADAPDGEDGAEPDYLRGGHA
jgi:endogenous inhibitor of DNA gyrase (YacG/DUF329 family)